MSKNYLLITFVFFCFTAYSQTYTFDYMVEYSYSDFADTLKEPMRPRKGTMYRFINSNSNACYMNVHERAGKTHMQPTLESGKFYLSNMPTEDFFVEGISMRCPYSGFIPPLNERPKDFEFVATADTIINTQPFKHYVLKPINQRKFEKGDIFIEHYIIDNSFNFQIPILLGQSLSYKFWKNGAKLPNGVLKEFFRIDVNGKRVREQKMVQILPIKKIIIIDNSKCK